jgi:hypothetical protein
MAESYADEMTAWKLLHEEIVASSLPKTGMSGHSDQ